MNTVRRHVRRDGGRRLVNFLSFSGRVMMINDFPISSIGSDDGCYTMMSIDDGMGGVVNFVVSPTTYFFDHAVVEVGDVITGYYDGDAPVPLIYPPQYRALIVIKENPYQTVKVDFFDSQLLSSDGQLKLNISPYAPIVLANGQPYRKNPANHQLIVSYGPTTRSIPAQTTPYKVVVWCQN